MGGPDNNDGGFSSGRRKSNSGGPDNNNGSSVELGGGFGSERRKSNSGGPNNNNGSSVGLGGGIGKVKSISGSSCLTAVTIVNVEPFFLPLADLKQDANVFLDDLFIVLVTGLKKTSLGGVNTSVGGS